jgi:hypothetical protein
VLTDRSTTFKKSRCDELKSGDQLSIDTERRGADLFATDLELKKMKK